MKRRNILGVSAVTLLGLAMSSRSAVAKQKTLKEQLIGTWLVVSNVTTSPDGTKVDTFGPNPKGIFIYESNGRFAIISIRAGIPKFASDNRSTGTADENKAVVQGSIAYFGTYSVNEADKSLTAQVESATFPNWVGDTQKRKIAISGDDLTFLNPGGSAGGSAEIKLKRAK